MKRSMPKYISKSRLMLGLHCDKALYLDIYHPELAAEIAAGQQFLFDQGREVGVAAQKEWPDGVLIDAPHYDHDVAIANTAAAIKDGPNAIFEATFAANGVVSKLDILWKIGQKRNPWAVVEVKSSTSVKDEHITDVAIQSISLETSGIKPSRYFVQHLSSDYRHGSHTNLFERTDVTGDIADRVGEVENQITDLISMLSKAKEPIKRIGPHCSSPYECKFIKHCWKDLPSPNVFEIPRIGKKAWQFHDAGIVSINNFTDATVTGARVHHVQSMKSGKRWMDAKAIARELTKWKKPLYFLDFETIGYAVPRIVGTKPYQNLPFQFSCHLQDGDTVKHYEYLHNDTGDPRPALANALVNTIGQTGSIVAYNAGFEAGCLKGLAEFLPQYSSKLESFIERLVDPLPLFQNYVYDPAFRGSFSLKAVAPAILGKAASYDTLEVRDGSSAQSAFVNMISDGLTDEERGQIRQALLAYCRRDTEVMIFLVEWLQHPK